MNSLEILESYIKILFVSWRGADLTYDILASDPPEARTAKVKY